MENTQPKFENPEICNEKLRPSAAVFFSFFSSARSHQHQPEPELLFLARAIPLRPSAVVFLSFFSSARGHQHQPESELLFLARAIPLRPSAAVFFSSFSSARGHQHQPEAELLFLARTMPTKRHRRIGGSALESSIPAVSLNVGYGFMKVFGRVVDFEFRPSGEYEAYLQAYLQYIYCKYGGY